MKFGRLFGRFLFFFVFLFPPRGFVFLFFPPGVSCFFFPPLGFRVVFFCWGGDFET